MFKYILRHADRQRVNHSHTNGTAVGPGCTEETVVTSSETSTVGVTVTTAPSTVSTKKRDKKELDREREAAEYLQRLEMDTKRLRNDLQSSRASEQELRLQVNEI